MSRVAVLGAGAWGTALADHAARHGHDVVLWAREPDVVAGVNARRENARFLAGVTLHEALRATGSEAEAVRSADIVLFVAPSHALRAVARAAADAVAPNALLCVATKGIEEGSLALMTDVVEDELPGHSIVALSGPSFAIDILRPRDRKAINHDSRYKDLRRQITEYLLGVGAKQKITVSRKLYLPAIEPEDLSLPRDRFARRKGPLRRDEIKREEVAIE